MQTLDQPVVETGSPVTTHRSWWMLVLAVVVALALGVLGGWWLAGATDDDPEYVVAGGGSLTDRQREMLDVLDRYNAAWTGGDAATVASLFAPSGVYVKGSIELTPGEIATYLERERATYSTLETYEPVLVDGAKVVEMASIYNDNVHAASVIEFTTSGEVLIRRHTVVW